MARRRSAWRHGSRSVADTRGQPAVGRHRPLSTLAEHHDRVRHSRPRGPRTRPGDRDAVGRSVPRLDPGWSHRHGAARPRSDEIHPARSCRAHASPHSSRDATSWSKKSTWRSSGSLRTSSSRLFDQQCAEDTRLEIQAISGPRSTASTISFPVPSARSHRTSAGSLVADSVIRRRDRRAPDEAIRHADLRAIGKRSGRHQPSSIENAGATSRSTRQRQSSPNEAASIRKTSDSTMTCSLTISTRQFNPERSLASKETRG